MPARVRLAEKAQARRCSPSSLLWLLAWQSEDKRREMGKQRKKKKRGRKDGVDSPREGFSMSSLKFYHHQSGARDSVPPKCAFVLPTC